MDKGEVTVVHMRDSAFALGIRGHMVTLDQPVEDGGSDSGPTPTELFVGAIAGCVGHYAASYMRRHGIRGPLTVSASYSMATGPTRVDAIQIRIHAPDVPVEQRPKLLAVARHCTLHNTLDRGPALDVVMDDMPGFGRDAAAAS